jgi:acyl-CoA hydrolase
MSPDEAAEFIRPGDNVGMSGFTGAGYPKAVPGALVRRVEEAATRGERFAVSVWTGASTAPELDGALAAVDAIDMRMPYQSDPVSRAKINAGLLDYLDMHLSHVAQMVWEGAFGHLDVAVIEVSGITEDGELIPSSSVGNNKTWIDMADRIILEVNAWQPAALEGMHDIYYGTALPPFRKPIQILQPSDRIGVPYFHCPPEKIVAVVETNSPDRNTAFKPVDVISQRIPGVRGEGRTPARVSPAPAVGRRQHRQCRPSRTRRWSVPSADGVHRGHPGRHVGLVELGHDEHHLGDRLLAQRGGSGRPTRQHRRVPRPDRPSTARDQQSP